MKQKCKSNLPMNKKTEADDQEGSLERDRFYYYLAEIF